MTDEEFSDIINLISKQTGIIPRESHKSGIKNFIEKREKEINLNGLAYYNYVCINKNEFNLLLNNSTVNETYFFREEAQFQLLKSKILPFKVLTKFVYSPSISKIYCIFLFI